MGFFSDLGTSITNFLGSVFKSTIAAFIFVFVLGMAYALFVAPYNNIFLYLIPPLVGVLIFFDSWILALFFIFLIVYFFR